MWEETSMSDDTTNIPPNPEDYTLLLQPDGAASAKVDCNQAKGTYTMTENSITIEMGATTLVFCGEESLDQTYLNNLAAVNSYFVQDGKLFFDLKFDSGTMRFSKQ